MSGDPEPPSKVVELDYDASDGNGMALMSIVPGAPIPMAGAGVSTRAPSDPVG